MLLQENTAQPLPKNTSQSEHAYYCSHIINFDLLQVCPSICIFCIIYTLFRDQSLFINGGGGGGRGWRDIIFINQLLFFRLWPPPPPPPNTHTHTKTQTKQVNSSKNACQKGCFALDCVNWLKIPLKDLKWCKNLC